MIKQMTNVEPLTVTKTEAARMIGVSTRTVHDLIATGVIPHVRFGIRGVRIPVDALKKRIAEMTSAK